MEKSNYLKSLCSCKVPPYYGFELLDPSIIYSIQLTNAAADQIFKMLRILEAVENEKFFDYADSVKKMGEKVTDVLDELIDFAAHYVKSSV